MHRSLLYCPTPTRKPRTANEFVFKSEHQIFVSVRKNNPAPRFCAVLHVRGWDCLCCVVLCAHHEHLDCALRERWVNELKKREGAGERAQQTARRRHRLRFVYRHTLTFKGKESAFSFPGINSAPRLIFSCACVCVSTRSSFIPPAPIKRLGFIQAQPL